jgi:hypothetical protein
MPSTTTPLGHYKTMLLLIALVLLGNWCFTFQIFSLKDDNSYYYMPMRMYLSDALHEGKLVFWNPYFQLGLPQYSDMQGAVWNPVALILCSLFRYNHTCFLAEYLIYLIIAAAGMYKLAQTFIKDFWLVALIVVVYILGGFTSAIANFFNWSASLAFLPWLFYFFWTTLQKPNYKKAIWLAIIIWLNTVCGYPGFLLYAFYILLVWLIVFIYQQAKQKNKQLIFAVLVYFLVSAVITTLLCLPAIAAYIEFFPYYFRGSHLATEVPFQDCVYPNYFNSLLVPSTVYNGDMISPSHSANRNLYIGVLPFVLCLLLVINFKKIKHTYKWLFAGIAIFTFVFLFGHLTPLGNLTYKYLPLLGASKWSAATRIFLSIVLMAGVALLLQQQKILVSNKQLFWYRIFAGIFVLLIGYLSYYWFYQQAWFTPKHKWLMLANAVWQMILWLSVAWLLPKLLANTKWLLLFVLIDLGINHSIGLAATGIATVPPKVYNEYCTKFYQQNPNDYLLMPPQQRYQLFHFNPWTNHNASKIFYPEFFIQSNTMFMGYENLFINNKQGFDLLKYKNFVFSDDVQQLEITNHHFGYNQISFTATCSNEGFIVVQQNFYNRWHEATGKPITQYKNCMMQLPVHKGINLISLQYNTGNFMQLFWVSIATLLVCSVFLLVSSKVYSRKIKNLL